SRAPSTVRPDVPEALDALVLRGLSRDPNRRFETAREMATALERVVPPATSTELGEWVAHVAGDVLRRRASLVAEIEHEPVAFEPAALDSASVLPRVEGARSKDKRTFPHSVGYAVAVAAIVGAAWTLLAPARSPPATLAPPPSSSTPLEIASAPSAELEPPKAPATALPSAGARRPPAHGGAPARRPAARPVPRSCEPPYVIDANGFRSPKAECL
ncbi:MAG TPA: hypothetical protein VM925_04560, partial [Labilithrix sp.]|nr:hypothetical protein [Labilithrix sp.]